MNRIPLFVRVLLFFFALAACAPIPIPTSDTPIPPAPLATPTLAPLPDGGAITLGILARDADAFLRNALFDSLLQPDPNTGAMQPALAESFQVAGDALTLTFKLRANVKWHTGDALTADDVVATINAFSAPDFRGAPAADFGTLSKVIALDAQTVQLGFRDAYCPALTFIGAMKIFPRALAAHAARGDAPTIGTGALKLISRDANQITLARNPDYFRGKPPIEEWTLKLYPDAKALRAAFAAQAIDAMPLAPGEMDAAKKIAGAKIFAGDSNEIVTLIFNLADATLNDARVRQAVGLAIDRNVLLNDLGGAARGVNANALPGFWATAPNISGAAFEPNHARQLLVQAGFRDNGDGIMRRANKPLALALETLGDDPLLEPLAFRLREHLVAIGIQVQLNLNDRAGLLSHAFQHRFDLLLLARKIPLDPDQRWYWQSDQNALAEGFNFGSYSNARVDQLGKQLNRVGACDAPGRAALFDEIQKQIVTDAPALFLLAPKKYFAATARVSGIAPSAYAGEWENLWQWRAGK